MNTLPLTRRERIIGGLIGLLVGDACGVPVEFSSRSERDSAPVFGMRGWGTHHQPAGTWSDDGAMALAHVDAFLKHGWDPHAHLDAFCQWYQNGRYSAHGHAFDIGVTTRLALRRFSNGRPLCDIGGARERDNGNGSLMRMLPVACYWAQEDAATIIARAAEASALTHAHPRSCLACAYYALVISRLLRGGSYAQSMAWANDHIVHAAHMRSAELTHFAPLLDGSVIHLSRNRVCSSGYVMSTLTAALWCCHHYGTDYRTCVLAAVNLGGDTDTIAAIVGSIAGVHLGLSAIDRNWVSQIPKSSAVFDQAEQFAYHCTASAAGVAP
ncbi:MAG: ADP-ribosylglycohydrolase family protein [Planctomycetota bacterium]|nr:MAG: ADP-ribosylglycohydrolase family protein [Planctomycetota bacterium]